MNCFRDQVVKNRTDLTDWLIHSTKDEKAFCEIVKSRKLIPKQGAISFTESPLSEWQKVLSMMEEYKKPRFSMFSIAVQKSWLFERCGRPVIYGPQDEKRLFPEELRFRYVEYAPCSKDFAWQREWRIQKEVQLDAKECFLLVPSTKDQKVVPLTHVEDGDSEDGSPTTYVEAEVSPDWYVIGWDDVSTADDDDQLFQEVRRFTDACRGLLAD